MRNISFLMLVGLIASCGDSGESTTEECLAMGRSSPTYPATYRVSNKELQEYSDAVDEFRDLIVTDGMDRYLITRHTNTISPVIRGDSIYVSDDWDASNGYEKLMAFVESWNTFFTPYNSEMRTIECRPDDAYCPQNHSVFEVKKTQEMCGLSVRGPSTAPEWSLYVQAHVETGVVGLVESKVVPQRPLPFVRLSEAQALELVDGLKHDHSCVGEVVLSTADCVISFSEPWVMITEGTPNGIEYRLVQTLEVAGDCDEVDSSGVRVTIDAVEKEVVSTRVISGCESF